MPDEDRKIGPIYRIFSQDLFATDLHSKEFGHRQHEYWRSKSRQFSKDAEIFGSIKEAKRKTHKDKLPDLKESGFIIIRKSLWTDTDELSRRLVIKLFSESGNWIASLEEMIAEEYSLTYSSGIPITVFVVMCRESEVVTYIRQVFRGATAMENFAFYILGPDNTFEVFRIERKRVSAGGDYNVKRLSGGQTIAEIDSKLGDIGGEYIVKIKDPVLAQNEWFCRVLQCFSVMLRFRDPIKAKIDKGLKRWLKQKFEPLQHRYEMSLLANPRKLSLKTEEFEEV
ncbi:MAG: hypothetical protein RTU30_15365 [Candidatus Thorarchaeota archaeon]